MFLFSFGVHFESLALECTLSHINISYSFLMNLQCSPDYAYGANGFGAWGIQPNSALVFEIEVLSAE